MVGNDIVVIRQMSLLVVVHENYGVSDSSQQGKTWKLWCFWLRMCTLIIFARVQQSDPWCYLKGLRLVMWSLLHVTYQLREMLSIDQSPRDLRFIRSWSALSISPRLICVVQQSQTRL